MNQIRLKYIASIEMGQSPPSSEYTTEDEGIPFLQGTAEFGEKYPSPIIYSLSPNKFSFKNDILFSVRAPVGEININNQKIGIGRGLCSIRAKNNNSQEFLWWALHAVRVQLKYLETGTTYSAVSTEDISNLVLPIHDLNIQNKIANYLDTEVAKIDALIDKKNQLIAILDEKKKAVINQAVTKGLDMNVCMKDSGVEWLGEIPKHWKVVKLKYLTNGLKYGANEAAEDDNHNDPRYIRITDIDENGDLKEETFRSIPLEVAEEYLLQDGDILLARSGATVGKSFYIKKNMGYPHMLDI
ncbi:restriction endonuclease subunit S [Algoriphagus halophilus]|uniref:restriction endonuclease subunit S n=1 Tax=Algoriphagus halophilus TaxID=226505 RepID=UPI00358E7BAD